MSNTFEAIITANDSAATEAESPDLVLKYAIMEIQPGVRVLFRSATRQDPIALEGLLTDAARLSQGDCPVLAVVYDDRVGYRESWFFQGGTLQRSFDECDELWVPVDDHGEPQIGATPLRLPLLDPEKEYDCRKNAIDLGIEAMDFSAALTCSILVNNASQA